MSGAAILAFLREASSDLSSSLPSYPPSQGSLSPTESGFINTRTILNYTRRCSPRFRLKWRLSHNVSRRWRFGSSTTGFNWTQPSPRPWSNQVRGHDPWLKAVSFQAGARRLVGYRRWSCGGQGWNQNTRCSSGPNLVNYLTSKWSRWWRPPTSTSVFSDMFAEVWLSNLPRWSPSVSSLLDSIIVTHSCMALQRRTSADSSVSRTISRELCFKLHGTPSSKPLFKHLHWLPVQQRMIFKIALVTFNERTFEQPSYLHSLLDNYIPSRNLRSEGQHLLRIPFRKSAVARRSFAFAAPTVWNSLNS